MGLMRRSKTRILLRLKQCDTQWTVDFGYKEINKNFQFDAFAEALTLRSEVSTQVKVGTRMKKTNGHAKGRKKCRSIHHKEGDGGGEKV